MSQLHRRTDVSELQYLEDQVRSLHDRLAESKGETKGAVMVASQISQRASDLDERLRNVTQSRDGAIRDNRVMLRAIAELMVDIAEGRDAQKTATLMAELLTGQGIVLSGEVARIQQSRTWRGAIATPAGDVSTSPVMASLHTDDRQPAMSSTARNAAASLATAVAHANVAASTVASAAG